MAIGDIESEDKGTAARYNDNKVEYELIPTHLLESCARVFMHGKKKYKAWNWAKGMPWSVVIGCMKRHLAAIERGEDFDIGPKGSGLRHVGHLMCNAIMLEHYMNAFPEGDDRPKWFAGLAEGAKGQTVDLPAEWFSAKTEPDRKVFFVDLGKMTAEDAEKFKAAIKDEFANRAVDKLIVATNPKPELKIPLHPDELPNPSRLGYDAHGSIVPIDPNSKPEFPCDRDRLRRADLGLI